MAKQFRTSDMIIPMRTAFRIVGRFVCVCAKVPCRKTYNVAENKSCRPCEPVAELMYRTQFFEVRTESNLCVRVENDKVSGSYVTHLARLCVNRELFRWCEVINYAARANVMKCDVFVPRNTIRDVVFVWQLFVTQLLTFARLRKSSMALMCEWNYCTKWQNAVCLLMSTQTYFNTFSRALTLRAC